MLGANFEATSSGQTESGLSGGTAGREPETAPPSETRLVAFSVPGHGAERQMRALMIPSDMTWFDARDRFAQEMNLHPISANLGYKIMNYSKVTDLPTPLSHVDDWRVCITLALGLQRRTRSLPKTVVIHSLVHYFDPLFSDVP
jgi:hypothetical protein